MTDDNQTTRQRVGRADAIALRIPGSACARTDISKAEVRRLAAIYGWDALETAWDNIPGAVLVLLSVRDPS